MEYYSASLWHLEKVTELSVLADDLRHVDTMRPETWCVMGNLMSLAKDHETAIKFIERAIQVTSVIVKLTSLTQQHVWCLFYSTLFASIGVPAVCVCLSITESRVHHH